MHSEEIAPSLEVAGRILIAEDNDDYRELLAMALRKKGFEVIEADEGRRVIAYLAACEPYGGRARPDVILSDVRMPGYSGLTILRGLTATRSRIPIILMTAFADPELRARALALGAFAVLDKPFTVVELLDTVARARFHGMTPH